MSLILFVAVLSACATPPPGDIAGQAERWSEHIVMIDITDRDLARFGRYPWPRDLHGLAVAALNQARAKGVLFDFIFTDPDTRQPEKDVAFGEALSNSRIPVFLPYSFVPEGGKPDLPDSTLVVDCETGHPLIQAAPEVLPPLPVLSSARTGHINVYYDDDEVLRSVRVAVKWHGRCYPYLGLVAAAALGEVPWDQVHVTGNALRIGPATLPLENGAALRLDFGHPRHTYQHYCYCDLLDGLIDDRIRNKFVIIAVNATGLNDFHVTPAANRFPGPEIHAAFLDQALAALEAARSALP